MGRPMDLNCDLGESFGVWRLGEEETVLPVITSASLACGMHAGDPVEMTRVVRRCQAYGVAVGAHPGYPDLVGFGRRRIPMRPEELTAYCLYQIGALEAIARAEGASLQHIKPHGALYNAAAQEETVARAVVEAVQRAYADRILVAPAGSVLERVAREAGLRVAR
ncbi:MAG: 5-oxoprolinase subunit PxpA, partial [Armatimonadota bacterium]|nr:5-oxoprolinase subunit PxpA [Armatimonadota bacterium]